MKRLPASVSLRLPSPTTLAAPVAAMVIALGGGVLPAAGCSVSDDERCEPGQEYVEVSQKWVCRPIAGPEAGAESSMESGPDTDAQSIAPDVEQEGAMDALDEPEAAAGDSGGEAGGPSGLDQACASDTECVSFEANYCLINPQTQAGYCTLKDCDPASDTCPAGHKCCDMPFNGVPNSCMKQADYDTMSGMGMCAK